jgi:hypothetical protein
MSSKATKETDEAKTTTATEDTTTTTTSERDVSVDRNVDIDWTVWTHHFPHDD